MSAVTDSFEQLAVLAKNDMPAFRNISRQECLAAARAFASESRRLIRARHDAGESGTNTVRMLTESADQLLRGVLDFALCSVANRTILLRRFCLCAFGGYGRAELSPHSDLDVCVLYEGLLDSNLESLNSYLIHFLWDIGLEVGYSIRSVRDTVVLAVKDSKAFTCGLESRLILGDSTTYARLKLQLRELLHNHPFAASYIGSKIHSRIDNISAEYRDPYAAEPNIKENRGGLRDYHTALWLLMITYGPLSMDDIVAQGLVTPEEHLDFAQALDFMWRVRNELHFSTNRAENVLTYDNQKRVARAFGYGQESGLHRLMEDYYAAASKLHRLFYIATQLCDRQYRSAPDAANPLLPPRIHIVVRDGQLEAGHDDPNWFAEQPSRLMEVFWECARRRAPLSRATERLVRQNQDLVTDAFRSSDLVRRFFIAICNRPFEAGFALRQAANAGLLGRYLPEFAAIQGKLCYEDFHQFPVDEHTLRAVEALALLPELKGPASGCLRKAIEHLPDSYILVMATLFHDLGKVHGEIHVEAGVEIARCICARIDMPEADAERIGFIVENHLLMTRISQYRDIDDNDIVQSFAKTMKTEERLRLLYLFSYADLSAVGVDVWNDWKAALLTKLFLKTERILLNREGEAVEEYWFSSKADEVRAAAGPELASSVEEHLRVLGERYFLAFSPSHIATHLRCLDQAKTSQLAVHCSLHEETGMSEIVICTQDRHGLFAKMAGSFASQLVDISNAALFTRPDGWVIDCFTVSDASRGRPITESQFQAVEHVLRSVLLDDNDIQTFVDISKRRLFALLQPRIPVYTRISFDNTSSRSHTVIDVETGDRTGLLYDMARAMADAGLDIATARIVTDARRVRDSFYVTLDDGKIETEEKQAAIRETLRDAIHPRAVAETKEI